MLVVLTGRVLARGRQLRVNARYDEPLRARGQAHEASMEMLRELGSRNSLVAGMCVLILFSLLARRGRSAIMLLLALPAAGAMTAHVLKPLVSANAPFNSHPGYPSGHATGAAALATAVLLLLPRAPRVGRWLRQLPGSIFRLAIGVMVAILALGSAASSVALQAHNTAAVIGGFLVGVTTVLLAALVVDAACDLIAKLRPRPG